MSEPLLHLLAPFARHQSAKRLTSTMTMADEEAAFALVLDLSYGLGLSRDFAYYQSGRRVVVGGIRSSIIGVLCVNRPGVVYMIQSEEAKTWTQAEVTHETRSA